MKQATNNKIKRKSGKKETKMEKTTTSNNFMVTINDIKNGGSLGLVWYMSNQEIETFNHDNAGNLQAVVITK
jgi:hypothetical protein